MKIALWMAVVVAVACASPVVGCGGDTESHEQKPKPVVVTPPPYGQAFDKLSDWHLFADLAKLTPAERVIPYEVISPLFSDYTTKFRFAYVPEGQQIVLSDKASWDFPEGSVLVKTFSYRGDLRDANSPLKLLETRILWKEPDGWSVHTYVWNDEQTDAVSKVTGETIDSSFIDAGGATVANAYHVPNTNECKECHTNSDVIGPLGLRTRQLDQDHDYGKDAGGVENQIDHFAKLGLLSETPPAAGARNTLLDPFGDGPIDLRARAFLDANCSSCHTTGGFASQSSLLLDYFATDPSNTDANWGVCKVPTSTGGATCGHQFDVVPGDPDSSIMVCRLTSTESKFRMPPLGVNLVYTEGVELIRSWISQMPAGTCTGN